MQREICEKRYLPEERQAWRDFSVKEIIVNEYQGEDTQYIPVERLARRQIRRIGD